MKQITFLLVIISFFSCTFFKSKRDIYSDKFYAYSDSINASYEYWLTNKDGKGKCYGQAFDRYYDSSKLYYSLMYPNGNPADKTKEEPPIPKIEIPIPLCK